MKNVIINLTVRVQYDEEMYDRNDIEAMVVAAFNVADSDGCECYVPVLPAAQIVEYMQDYEDPFEQWDDGEKAGPEVFNSRAIAVTDDDIEEIEHQTYNDIYMSRLLADDRIFILGNVLWYNLDDRNAVKALMNLNLI